MNGAIPSVSFVLNVFRRQESLSAQLAAIDSQTVPIQSVFIWQNGSDSEIPGEIDARSTVARCSENLGVWSRFAFALNTDSEYVCMLDDDTIPGRRWIENCLTTIKTHEGLLGTRGMRFRSPLSYHHADDFGWRSPNSVTERVDVVGHAWFFKREWLHEFWAEPPALPAQVLKGEDIHFSYVMQQRLGLGTYVPPHPPEDLDLWGSQPKWALELGMGEESISGQYGAMDEFQKVYRAYIKQGFTLCSTGRKMDDAVALAAGFARSSRFTRLSRRLPVLRRVKSFAARRFGGRSDISSPFTQRKS